MTQEEGSSRTKEYGAVAGANPAPVLVLGIAFTIGGLAMVAGGAWYFGGGLAALGAFQILRGLSLRKSRRL